MSTPHLPNPTPQPPEQPLQLAILGSTGSIGEQTLDVLRAHPQFFQAHTLTANRRAQELIAQAREFRPQQVVVCDPQAGRQVQQALADLPISVMIGAEHLAQAVQHPAIDRVLTAIVGAAGLAPTLAALRADKDLAIANKETLVVAGQLVMQEAQKRNLAVLPVDSEHSALFQCLVGEPVASIHKLILTASGGPFRGYTAQQLQAVTRAQALKHPNWSMGAKITIDSASMMNKGLEVIEARWLFDLPGERIDIVVHPQSILHSVVEFVDGSLKAQMGLPDMRAPIQYALTYPQRLPSDFPRFRFADYPQLTFEQPDREVFRSLNLAYHSLEQAGNFPCALNAANEVVVQAFLEDRIAFHALFDHLENALDHTPYLAEPKLEDLLETDQEVRNRLSARLL